MSGVQWLRGAAAGLAAALALTGCHSSPPSRDASPIPPTTETAAAPVPPVASAEGLDRTAVETAYHRYWVVSRIFDQQYPLSQWRQVLGQVAMDPHLGLVLARASQQRRDGIKLYGQVVPHPTVLPINGADQARIRDCQDASHAGQADARTGRARTVGIARNPVVAVLRRGNDGSWRVYSIDFPGGTC